MQFDKDGRLRDPKEGMIERLWYTKAGRIVQATVIGLLLVVLAYGAAGALFGDSKPSEDACNPVYFNDC